MSTALEDKRRTLRELACSVVLEDNFEGPITSVGGVDLAFMDDLAVVACVTVDYDSLQVKFEEVSTARLDFPYVSTLLSFREGPPIIDAIRSMEPKPEVFLINAQGVAHPMGCGCASYVGVRVDVPTIGVAQRNLCGEYECEPEEVGGYMPIYYCGRAVGWALKTREGCRPIFVSPGHRVSLRSSLEIVLRCVRDHKLPEPLYLAHVSANEEKRRMLKHH